MATTLEVDDRLVVAIFRGVRIFSVLLSIRTCSGAHSLLSSGQYFCFRGQSDSRVEAENSCMSIAHANNYWSFTFTH